MKQKTVYICSECGYEAPKWMGKCPVCGTWNTFEETEKTPAAPAAERRSLRASKTKPERITDIGILDEDRVSTGISELDRVLGGGAVVGSFILVGGEPGVGKSTLLMQTCETLCRENRVLYVSGEESARQLKLRADRLGINPESLYLYAQTRLEDILSSIEGLAPQIVIIDSIQTIFTSSANNAPGSVTQIRESAQGLMRCAKENGVTIFIVGHVNKEGTLAGPKILEHMVDCVLYFEGERHMSYRIVRAAKNRYGSTDEIGVFEMTERGLKEVPNPSQALLAGRPHGASGSCIGCIMEGSRQILAEIQALITPTGFNVPRRMSAGFDYNRAMLLMAVTEKRAGIKLSNCDAYLNVTGGLRIDDPSADLPAVIAVASSVLERPASDDMVCFGEVGLTGELRSVSHAQQRVNEAARLGFRRCIVPHSCSGELSMPKGMEAFYAKNIREAIRKALTADNKENS